MDGRFECCRYRAEPRRSARRRGHGARAAQRRARPARAARDDGGDRAPDRASRPAPMPTARRIRPNSQREHRKFEPDAQPGAIVGERHGAVVAVRDGAHQAEPEAVARACCGSVRDGRSGRTPSRGRLRGCRDRDRPPRSPPVRRWQHPDSNSPPSAYLSALSRRLASACDNRWRSPRIMTLGLDRQSQRKPFLLGHRLVEFDRRARHLAEIERLGAIATGARLGLGDPQQRVEGREQAVGLVDRGADRLAWAPASAGPISASSSRARNRDSGVFRSWATSSVTSRIAVISRSI